MSYSSTVIEPQTGSEFKMSRKKHKLSQDEIVQQAVRLLREKQEVLVPPSPGASQEERNKYIVKELIKELGRGLSPERPDKVIQDMVRLIHERKCGRT